MAVPKRVTQKAIFTVFHMEARVLGASSWEAKSLGSNCPW